MGTSKSYLPGVGSRRTQSVVAMHWKRREGGFQHCPLLYYLACSTHLLSNVMQSNRFLSHLILTLSWCPKNKIRSRWEKFAPSYNPFFCVIQITILATVRITINTTCFSPWNRGKLMSSSTSYLGLMWAVHFLILFKNWWTCLQ